MSLCSQHIIHLFLKFKKSFPKFHQISPKLRRSKTNKIQVRTRLPYSIFLYSKKKFNPLTILQKFNNILIIHFFLGDLKFLRNSAVFSPKFLTNFLKFFSNSINFSKTTSKFLQNMRTFSTRPKIIMFKIYSPFLRFFL